MDSSDKIENSVLGYRFSEKVDHLPIKKRRFLFETPSSPPNTEPSEETVSVAACVHSSSQEVDPKPEASDPPSASMIVADLNQSGSIDREMDGEKFVKDSEKASEDGDICDTSLVDQTACSNGLGGDADLGMISGMVSNDTASLEATGSVELEEKSVKLETLSAMETNFDISVVPSKLDCPSEDIRDTSVVDQGACSNGLDGDNDICESSGIVPNETKSLEVTGNIELKAKSVKLETLSAIENNFDTSVVPSKLDCSSADIRAISLVDQAACSNGLGGDTDIRESSGVVSNDTKSLEASGNVELKAKSVKLETLSAMETDLNTSTVPSKLDYSSADKATVDESILDNSLAHVPTETECSKMNQETIKIQNSADLDDRLNWDLNTVMTAWEEPLECDKTINTAFGSVSENIGNASLPVELKSLTPKIEESELEACKPGSNGICKLLSPVICNAPHVDSSTNDIPISVPSTLTLEYATCDISVKHVSVDSKGTNDLSRSLAAVTDFSLDYNKPKENVGSSKVVDYGNSCNNEISTVQRTENEKLTLSLVTAGSIDREVHQSGSTFDEDDKSKVKKVVTSNGVSIGNLIAKVTESSHNVVPSNIVGSVKYVNHAITTLQTTENEKLKLSLVTTTSLENEVHKSGSALEEDDKSKVKPVIASNGVTMENLSGKGTEISKNGHEGKCQNVNQTNVGSLLLMQSSVSTEGKEPPPTVSSMHEVVSTDAEVPIKSEKLPVTETTYRRLSHESRAESANDLVNNNKEVSDYENFPSDIQAGSEVDNVEEEFSYGFNSQFEDGEFRESSIQTWDEYDEDDRVLEHGTDLGAFNAHKNSSLCAPESSQKGADEISSLLLPEKLDSNDQVSGSEPNETEKGITEVNMKDASHSDQWKMNISGSDILPENPTSSSNITKIRDLRSIKFSSRIGRYGPQTDDLETKAEGSRFYRREPRDTFLNKGRFRMQGCSSSNADDSFRSVRRGKYTSRIPTRGPFMGPSILTNEPNVDPNITRQPFRTRLLANREEDEFRARLGLRPSNDTCQNRLVNVGRGRSLRYDSRHNGGGPRGRYYVPETNDEYDEPSVEYLHPIPVRRRCFSPTHHRPGSTSPPRSLNRSPINDGFRHRSRSPILRSDTRIRRINLEPRNNNSPPTSRWVNYKQRPSVFDRRSSPPPPPPINERVTFFESSRKTKPNENYRPVSGRFSEVPGGGRGGPRYDGDETDHGYRHGEFVRRYDMGRPVKHIQYDDEDGYDPVYESRDKEVLEFHGRGNPKPYISNGTDSRFRDLPRRPREDRESW